MVSKLFAHSSKALFRVFREEGGAFWLREGQSEADYLDCHFIEDPNTVDAQGFTVESVVPTVTFQVDDIARIDPARAARGDEALKTKGRDKITVGGIRYAIESCRKDGHGWLKATLYRAEDDDA